MRRSLLLIAMFVACAWARHDTLWINPVAPAESLKVLATIAPSVCADSVVPGPSGEEIGTFIVQRRDTFTVMCKPLPPGVLAAVINGASCNGQPRLRLEIVQVNMQFDETRRAASRNIRAMLDCKIVVRNAVSDSVVQTLSLQAEESKVTVSIRRHVAGLIRSVFINAARQILGAVAKIPAEPTR